MDSVCPQTKQTQAHEQVPDASCPARVTYMHALGLR